MHTCRQSFAIVKVCMTVSYAWRYTARWVFWMSEIIARCMNVSLADWLQDVVIYYPWRMEKFELYFWLFLIFLHWMKMSRISVPGKIPTAPWFDFFNYWMHSLMMPFVPVHVGGCSIHRPALYPLLLWLTTCEWCRLQALVCGGAVGNWMNCSLQCWDIDPQLGLLWYNLIHKAANRHDQHSVTASKHAAPTHDLQHHFVQDDRVITVKHTLREDCTAVSVSPALSG